MLVTKAQNASCTLPLVLENENIFNFTLSILVQRA